MNPDLQHDCTCSQNPNAKIEEEKQEKPQAGDECLCSTDGASKSGHEPDSASRGKDTSTNGTKCCSCRSTPEEVKNRQGGDQYDCCCNGTDGEVKICTCVAKKDGLVKINNPNLASMDDDTLYHLCLMKSQNLEALFGDVKFVCMGGSPHRMEKFAHYIQEQLKVEIPYGTILTDVSVLSFRYCLYKIGPVLSVSHGMGISSISILLHELIKLMHYAKAKNPIFFRIGTSGGLGLTPGTVVISDSVCDTSNRDYQEVSVLGHPVRRPAILDQKICHRLKKFVRPDDGFEAVHGKTMCTLDFYEEQGRLDGAICEFTEPQKMDYLNKLKQFGVVNIEMEGIPFAALTHQAGIQASMVCVTLLDRLKGDQVNTGKDVLEEYQTRPQILVTRYIKKYFEKLAEKQARERGAQV